MSLSGMSTHVVSKCLNQKIDVASCYCFFKYFPDDIIIRN